MDKKSVTNDIKFRTNLCYILMDLEKIISDLPPEIDKPIDSRYLNIAKGMLMKKDSVELIDLWIKESHSEMWDIVLNRDLDKVNSIDISILFNDIPFLTKEFKYNIIKKVYGLLSINYKGAPLIKKETIDKFWKEFALLIKFSINYVLENKEKYTNININSHCLKWGIKYK